MPDRLSIIVPAYNERATIGAVLDLLRTMPLPVPRDIIVVNDGSVDGTREILDAIELTGEPLTIVHAAGNRGKGAAIRLGLSRASGTIIAIQDADLELDPRQLADLVQPIVDGETSVVYGSRFLQGGPAGVPWMTRAANRMLTTATNLLFDAALTDMETCYKLIRIDIARSLALESDRYDIEPEITAKLLLAGHAILERPVTFSPRSRAAGKKIGWRDGLSALSTLVRLRRTRRRAVR